MPIYVNKHSQSVYSSYSRFPQERVFYSVTTEAPDSGVIFELSDEGKWDKKNPSAGVGFEQLYEQAPELVSSALWSPLGEWGTIKKLVQKVSTFASSLDSSPVLNGVWVVTYTNGGVGVIGTDAIGMAAYNCLFEEYDTLSFVPMSLIKSSWADDTLVYKAPYAIRLGESIYSMPNDGSHIYDMFIKSCTKKMPQCSIWLLKPREFEKIARAYLPDQESMIAITAETTKITFPEMSLYRERHGNSYKVSANSPTPKYKWMRVQDSGTSCAWELGTQVVETDCPALLLVNARRLMKILKIAEGELIDDKLTILTRHDNPFFRDIGQNTGISNHYKNQVSTILQITAGAYIFLLMPTLSGGYNKYRDANSDFLHLVIIAFKIFSLRAKYECSKIKQ